MKNWLAVFIGAMVAAPIYSVVSSIPTKAGPSIDEATIDLASENEAIADTDTSVSEAASEPKPISFVCDRSTDIPTTVARSSESTIPILRWDADEIGHEDSPQIDCETGSERFQSAYDSSLLTYITTGRMDGQLVVCAAEATGERCLIRLLDLDIAANRTPREALQQVLHIRLPTSGPIDETGPRPYISFERYFNGGYESTDNSTREQHL